MLREDPRRAWASQIQDHHEKQKFLKALYESFYKAYNPKAADRLGIVYTPDAIVRFMIESADHLVYKHFGKTLGDKGVEILERAVTEHYRNGRVSKPEEAWN